MKLGCKAGFFFIFFFFLMCSFLSVFPVKAKNPSIFGDTINTTSRMESYSEPMRINVSETKYHLLAEKFRFTPREPMEIKGKGLMKMYFLEG